MTDTPKITLEESNGRGRYVLLPEGGQEEAKLTYTRESDDLIIVDHTGVPPVYRGKGYAKMLADRVVADAREKGFRIVPACRFIKVMAERNDWADVIAE